MSTFNPGGPAGAHETSFRRSSAGGSDEITKLLEHAFQPVRTIRQFRVTVAGEGVVVLAAADASIRSRDIMIVNTGTAAAAVRFASGAAAAGTNGEVPLKAGTASMDGTGGVLNQSAFLGTITAACATSTTLAVSIVEVP